MISLARFIDYTTNHALLAGDGIADDEDSLSLHEIKPLLNSNIKPYEVVLYHLIDQEAKKKLKDDN